MGPRRRSLLSLAGERFRAYGPASAAGNAAHANAMAILLTLAEDPDPERWCSWLAARASDWAIWSNAEDRGSCWPG